MRSLFEKTIQEAILDLIGRSDSGADLSVKKVLGSLIPSILPIYSASYAFHSFQAIFLSKFNDQHLILSLDGLKSFDYQTRRTCNRCARRV